MLPLEVTERSIPKVVAHRGCPKSAPENSIAGFRLAVDLNVDAVEFDVHLTADGEPIVVHDPWLSRTVHASGVVADHTLSDITQFRLRGNGNQTVPDFCSVLDVFSDTNIELHIELKLNHRGELPSELVSTVLSRVAERNLTERSILTCFDPAVVCEIAERDPAYRVLLSVNHTSLGMLGGLNQLHKRVSGSKVFIAVERRLFEATENWWRDRFRPCDLGVWMVNDEDDIQRYLRSDLRQITTDYANVAMNIKEQMIANCEEA